jgi:hypothetical protein
VAGGRARQSWNVPYWRDESAYPRRDELSDKLWRWEFIRRMPDYRAAWAKAAEREYEIMREIASASNRDLSQFLGPDDVYFTVARAVYEFRKEFNDVLKYHSHPFPNPRLSYQQLGGLVGFDYRDEEGGILAANPEPIGRDIHTILFANRVLIEFDLVEPGLPQFERARAGFERLQADYVKKQNYSNRLAMKSQSRRRKDMWPRYLRVLDARDECVSYEEIGIELKRLAERSLEIEGMGQKQADAHLSQLERAKSDAKKWHKAALRVANKEER